MSAPAAGRADVAAVVIGRNEGARLLTCLRSLRGRVCRVVYVDSGSHDGSLEAARGLGAATVALDMAQPFTAARARNAGAAAALAGPDGVGMRYLQFVDGDCALDPGWVAAAASFLDSQPDVAVVCGRRRERRPEASPYNRLCDMEWDTPVGEAAACGGDALMRREAFEAVGGFDPTLIAGEEPELCLRLRRAGWRVWRLDAAMTAHDAAIHRFGQWWRRAMRNGWARAEGAARHGAGPERYNRGPLRSILLWGAAGPAAIALTATAAAGLAVAGGPWGAPAAAAGLGLAAYPLQAMRVARSRAAGRGDRWRDAAFYGVFTMLGKPAEALGALRYARHARRGGAARLIEYKNGAAPSS